MRARSLIVICFIFLSISFYLLAQTTQVQPIPASGKDSAAAARKSAKNAADSEKEAKTGADKSARSADQSQGSAQNATSSAEKAKTAADDSAQSASDTDKSAQTIKADSILQRLSQRKAPPKKPPLSDYVPCMFAGDEDFDLRSRPNPYVKRGDAITEIEADKIATIAINQAVANHTIPAQTDDSLKNQIVNAIIGLTPNDATQKIQSLLAENANAANELTSKISEIVDNALKVSSDNPSAQSNLTQQLKTSHLYDLRLSPIISNVDISTLTNLKKKQEFVQALKPTITQVATSEPASSSVKQAVASRPTFDRPDDVSCSFSIMDWHETSDVFGRRVANQYIAIQVNIRNLSKDSEFLVHDIQIAVDTGVNPRQLGRFQAGRDRIIVRSVAQRGQSEDRRNLILNTMQMIGNIAGGASTAFTHATVDDKDTTPADKLSTAVELFQGPFITGLLNIFPDHTLEHINHISDLAFSASSVNKTVIPIQGAVPLVTFLVERPLEQLPFARCGTVIQSSGSGTDSGSTNTVPSRPGSARDPFCQLEPDDDVRSTTDPEPSVYPATLRFKKWKPAALQVLERRMYVVVAGVHIQEVSNAPTLTAVKCPLAGPDNVVDLSQVDKDGNVSCNLAGKHLDKAASTRLALKARSVSANIDASSDGNTGTMTFKADDFNGTDNAGIYEIFIKDNSGNDNDTGQSLKFGTRTPTITSVAPPTLKGQPVQLTITGSNLDRVKDVNLVDSSDPKKTAAGAIQNPDTVTSSTTSIVVSFADLSTLVATANIQLTTKDGVTLPDAHPIQIQK
jgi:hypothetical protein